MADIGVFIGHGSDVVLCIFCHCVVLVFVLGVVSASVGLLEFLFCLGVFLVVRIGGLDAGVHVFLA